MPPVHHEKVFEDAIESALLARGWVKGSGELYDHALGLNPIELLHFVQASQPKEWDRLVTAQAGDEAGAAQRLAIQVEDRDPKELLFARRALAHFAVDQELVFVTTRLAKEKTRFLPFNNRPAR